MEVQTRGPVSCSLRFLRQATTLRVIMSIFVDVHLLSGKCASMEVEVAASVESLKHRAECALLVRGGGRLLNASGEVGVSKN